MDHSQITITAYINGTDTNPWHKMGLVHNPFPQIAKAEYHRAEMQINSLDGNPVSGPDDIRDRLKGFSAEFIELCISQFRPGKRVGFDVTFPSDKEESWSNEFHRDAR